MEARGTVLPHSGEKGQPNFELIEQRSADVGQIGLSRGELLPGHHRVASCRTRRFSGGALAPAAGTSCWAAGVLEWESSWTAGTFILCYRAASNSSTTLPSGSSSKIRLPPGPTTTSLRKRRARFISATRDTRSPSRRRSDSIRQARDVARQAWAEPRNSVVRRAKESGRCWRRERMPEPCSDLA